MIDKSQIRDAATIILIRPDHAGPHVLMGQRGQGAAFMPNKFVFPGGAVDDTDKGLLDPLTLDPESLRRLCLANPSGCDAALVAAGIRELWEETGLALARDGVPFAAPVPENWQDFAGKGYLPAAAAMRYMFRAVTPPGRPRRFDARFFISLADQVVGDLDDFSRASGELSHLQWVPLDKARALELPFITEVVLAEVEDLLKAKLPDRGVPFFNNSGPMPAFETLD